MSPDSLYPAAITACAAAPAVPPRPAAGLPRDDKAKAQYDLNLHSAWADCHDTVSATAKRKADYQAQFDARKAASPGFHLPSIKITNPFTKPPAAASAAPVVTK